MATSGSEGTAAAADDATAAHTIVPAPIATNDQHVCFICLQNDADTPNASWVNPCPCSLEAHSECMLRWIAEMETGPQRSSRDGLRCPACKAPIGIEEPYDPVVALQDGLFRRYSRLSPYLLATFMSLGSISASAWYGMAAAEIFAGPEVARRWLWQQQRLPSLLFKVWLLSSVGPGLVIMRWLPSLGTTLLLPFSLLYGANLVANDHFLTWPPSPRWAVTLMPFVHLSYTHLFYDIFGPLERRLNRALRGLPPAEDGAEQRVEAAPADGAAEPAAAEAADRNGEGADGIWGTVANLGRAIMGLFLDLPAGGAVGIEVEIDEQFEFRIGGAGHDDEDGDENDNGAEGGGNLVEGDDGFQLLVDNVAAEPAAQQPGVQPAGQDAAEQADDRQPPANQPEPQAAERNPPPQNQDNQNQRRNNGAGGPGEVSPFILIINSIVTSLLLPAISYGMGELIHVALPKGLALSQRAGIPNSFFGFTTRRSPAPGLLQQRWGRSLVGGCLFVVLRDVMALYAKYRRVQVRAKRRVKNVDRRARRETGGGTA